MQIFGKDSFPGVQQYFRYLHFTSEAESQMDGTAIKRKPGTAGKRVLRFSFLMPPADKVRHVIRRNLESCFTQAVLGHEAADGQPYFWTCLSGDAAKMRICLKIRNMTWTAFR